MPVIVHLIVRILESGSGTTSQAGQALGRRPERGRLAEPRAGRRWAQDEAGERHAAGDAGGHEQAGGLDPADHLAERDRGARDPGPEREAELVRELEAARSPRPPGRARPRRA